MKLKLLALAALTISILSAQANQSPQMSVGTKQGSVPQASVVGTAGSAQACYWLVTNYGGGSILSTSQVCLTNIPTVLSGGNYVQLSWTASTGIGVTYDVIKVVGSSPGNPIFGTAIGLTTGLTTTSYQDTGGGLSTYNAPVWQYPTATATWRLNNWDFNPPYVETTNWGVNLRARNGIGNIVSLQYLTDGTNTRFLTPTGGGACFGQTAPVSDGATCFGPTGALLNGIYEYSGVLTIAQINSGTIIVPAVTGRTLKVIRIFEQAAGGSTAGCTAVQVTDTTGTPVVATSTTAATLTSGTVVTESTASGVTLTTFGTALTANQGLQVIKTGSSCTTATGIEFIVMYSINS